jgi:hypothetical protein
MEEESTYGKKNAAAVRLGRLGGKATAKKLTPEQRRASAKKSAIARWSGRKTDDSIVKGA